MNIEKHLQDNKTDVAHSENDKNDTITKPNKPSDINKLAHEKENPLANQKVEEKRTETPTNLQIKPPRPFG